MTRERVAGVVVEPGEDLDVGAVGEAVVGEVGLPALVGLLGFEADVGGLAFLLRLGVTRPAARRRWIVARDTVMLVCCEVPGDRVGAGVEALRGELRRSSTIKSTVAAAVAAGGCAVDASGARTPRRPRR